MSRLAYGSPRIPLASDALLIYLGAYRRQKFESAVLLFRPLCILTNRAE